MKISKPLLKGFGTWLVKVYQIYWYHYCSLDKLLEEYPKLFQEFEIWLKKKNSKSQK